ncbi:MAG: hypothetical protein IT162_22760 [Bryobacterales bacterium]|nr:hypothetical protein [Bryobacterales bacterium]
MLRLACLLPLAVAAASTQKPFAATAHLGQPAPIGTRAFVIGTNEPLEVGLLREVTLESASLAYVFPNPVENVVAAANEKLLILRGRMRNPEKTSNFGLSASAVVGLRLWQRYTGPGKFAFVSHYDPDTLRPVQKNLKGGESGAFIGVWRVPADFTDFRLGLTSERATIIPWYDLRESVARLPASPFTAPDGLTVLPGATVPTGQAFTMGGLEYVCRGVTQPRRVAGADTDPAKPVYVVTLAVSNPTLRLPARWGWQYVTAELVDAAGGVTKAYPNIYDAATDAAWSRDLAPGASTRSLFLFYPTARIAPREFRLRWNEAGHRVTVPLR